MHGQYIGRGVLPIFKHLHGWLDVVRPEYETWGIKLKYEKDDFLNDLSSLINVDTLSVKISKTRKDTMEWLNKIYKFLVDQNMLNEFDNYAIIPNQRGEFKNKKTDNGGVAVFLFRYALSFLVEEIHRPFGADRGERENRVAEVFESFGHRLALFVVPVPQYVVHLVSAREVAADAEA
ncbi:hypothetical protein LEA_05727, partial [human gut metagenome]